MVLNAVRLLFLFVLEVTEDSIRVGGLTLNIRVYLRVYKAAVYAM